MKTINRIARVFLFLTLASGVISTACIAACKFPNKPANLTVPVAMTLPDAITTVPTGSVIYQKEASLAQLSGVQETISSECQEAIKNTLSGRIPTSQTGKGTYATAVPGLGIRVTVIYDKPGAPHEEWVVPFSTRPQAFGNKNVTTDDIKIRFEAIKTGNIHQSGIVTIRIPSLIKLSDNSLIVNLALSLKAPAAHCMIQVDSPQIDLPAVTISELVNERDKRGQPVDVTLNCINTSRASLSIEGVIESQHPTIFKNLLTENSASGVGIEMLFNGSVMTPGVPMDIALPEQPGYLLPLSVRYKKTDSTPSGGKVKTQVTLHINYL